MKLTLTFDEISEAQAITLVKMAKIMEYCGNIGTSRNVTFFADGDGDFRPKVSYESDGELGFEKKPLEIDLNIWETMDKHSDFRLDYDSVAWQIGDTDCNLTKDGQEKYNILSLKHKILK